ncbi:MAG: gliding motility-associated C-terminal domain-containing protein [Bacteroidota bacterium]
MRIELKYVLFAVMVLLGLMSPHQTSATHNRAGEITYIQISQFVYQATIITYTKTSSPADRPDLELFWGDGTSSILPRTSFQDEYGGPGSDIRRNIYTGTHTYPGPSIYTLYFEDPNRNGGVVNIPNSINVPFYVESQLIISAFLGFNNSPVLLQPPIDQGVLGQPFVHNPNAYDPDGDSLSYHLIPCKGAGGVSIGGYAYPQASNSFTLDPVTGDLEWVNPIACGEYNIAILIREWRSGVQIGFVERDMQVNIICNNPNSNAPPSVSPLQDICVTAGDSVSFVVTATDPDATDLVILSGTGGPLEVSVSPAIFSQPVSGTGSVSSNFFWQTDCEHVRVQPYQMVFKAEDNDPFVNLADLLSMRITVVAPAPQNLIVTPIGNTMSVSWDPSICTQATGYGLYRRSGFSGFVPSSCQTGVPASTGYVRIATLTGLNNTTYTDNNTGIGFSPGTEYCYLVIAEFSDGAESYASSEVCASLKKELPVLTNASVLTTELATGQVYVAWSKPTDLDTLLFPPPYSYRVMRSSGNTAGAFQLVTTNSGGLDDTLFTDTGLNTKDSTFTYRIDLFATQAGTGLEVGGSSPSSTVYLTAIPTDEAVLLSWAEQVAWVNTEYTVYRFNGSSFDSIGFSTSRNFKDSLLLNGQSYCYKIRSKGSFSTNGFVDPIYNFSQEACATPIDNVPPCQPNGTALKFDCEKGELEIDLGASATGCDNDVAFYTVYFKPDYASSYETLQVLNVSSGTAWIYSDSSGVSGCYKVAATDSLGNISEFSEEVCLEYCPSYELPNIFTPDGNLLNDLFIPFPYRFVESVDVKIFNRWGQLVFETNEPGIMWNGKSQNEGSELPSGTYFYVCVVEERFLSGLQKRELNGTLQLNR